MLLVLQCGIADNIYGSECKIMYIYYVACVAL